MVLAFVIRSLPFGNYIIDGVYRFEGPDPYDHLRRIILGIHSFPRIPTYDYYYGFPVGTGQVWAPLFDYLVSGLALVCGGSDRVAECIGFWLNPVLGALTVVILYRFGAVLASRRAGAAAALILALLPAHIVYSLVAKLDHHVVEPILCLSVIASLTKWESSSRTKSSTVPQWLWTGICFFVVILFWRGSTIFWGLAVVSLAVQVAADAASGRDAAARARDARNASVTAAILLVPVCFFNFLGTSGGMKFGVISWFHVGFWAASALFFTLLKFAVSGKRRQALLMFLTGLVALLLAALTPYVREFAMQFISGLTVIGGGDPWLDSIIELQPIFMHSGRFDVLFPIGVLSVLYILLPLMLMFRFREWRRRGYESFATCQFIVWGTAFFILPIFRERYMHISALFVALGGGLLVESIFDDVKKNVALASVAGVAFFASVASYLIQLPGMKMDDYMRVDLFNSLKWLDRNTQPTSYYYSPTRKPEYGVMSDWTLGAYITYLGRRPTVATNFGWETYGLYQSAAFLMTSDSRSAMDILQQNEVRYVFLSNLNSDLESPFKIARQGIAKGLISADGLQSLDIKKSMYYRLMCADGAELTTTDGAHQEALGNLRLVHESAGSVPGPFGPVSYYKIFQVVPAALFKGTASAGERVEVGIRLVSPAGRTIAWHDSAVADTSGRFTLRLPYPTGLKTGELTPLGEYILKVGGKRTHLSVSEADVLSGADVSLQGGT